MEQPILFLSVEDPALLKALETDLGLRYGNDCQIVSASIPGVFAAGDVRHGSVKRGATAVGEGAIAVQLLHQFLLEGTGVLANT